ncbi:SDR family NAD(P)-dependent oxidoreductase [Roseateles sp.]|uniref:SDR family NAD(P)-dependent oxidoreductase n=1 Tax=Roseateles sp. TaxID=1971397 RepID=UPI003BAC6F6E
MAVITGAAGGIGAALALQLAERGCHLALSDVNASGLEAVAAQARAIDGTVTVTTQVLDMARPESAYVMLADVLARHGRATILVNNAGVALGGTFEQVAEADFDWLMSINFSAVVRLTRTFLPLLRQAPAAQIVNLSSIFGIIAPPGQTAYCAAKFAVRGFSESLRHELEAGRSTVGVTVVHPGGVRTGIAANARLPKGASPAELKMHQDLARRALRLSPEAAAARILRGIEGREPRVMVGSDAVAAAWVQRLFPVTYWKWVARGLARQGIRVP